MCNRILDFLGGKQILFDKQFGFRAKYSTDYAILSIVDKIQRAIDERDFSCGIFLDFSKAFDTVDPEILIKKLEYYGIRGIARSWFISYLKDRKQFDTINNTSTNPASVNCGIPQGSVLGSILFFIYINDFHLCSDFFEFNLFADDANLFSRQKSITILQTSINKELVNIHDWLCANKLSLNIELCSFSSSTTENNFKLNINDKYLRQENYIKYLGIFIDSTLSWKPQIEYIIKK